MDNMLMMALKCRGKTFKKRKPPVVYNSADIKMQLKRYGEIVKGIFFDRSVTILLRIVVFVGVKCTNYNYKQQFKAFMVNLGDDEVLH